MIHTTADLEQKIKVSHNAAFEGCYVITIDGFEHGFSDYRRMGTERGTYVHVHGHTIKFLE